MRPIGEGQFSVATFFGAAKADHEKCDINGLPLTPSSVTILGRFQRLLRLEHSKLNVYLDLQRGSFDRVFVIQEHYLENLEHWLPTSSTTRIHSNNIPLSLNCVANIGAQIAAGLSYLHNDQDIVHGDLNLNNVQIYSYKNGIPLVRLSGYGLNWMTNNGQLVDFPIGDLLYIAPEIFGAGPESKHKGLTPLSDSWSLAVILVQLVYGICHSSLWKARQRVGIYVNLIRKAHKGSIFGGLIEAMQNAAPSTDLTKLPPPQGEMTEGDEKPAESAPLTNVDLKDLISSCLSVDISKRLSSKEILESLMELLSKTGGQSEQGVGVPDSAEDHDKLISAEIERDILDCSLVVDDGGDNFDLNHSFVPFKRSTSIQQYRQLLTCLCLSNDQYSLKDCPIDEVYYLWRIAGSNVESLLQKKGTIRTMPPILSLPEMVTGDFEMFGRDSYRESGRGVTVTPLSMKNLVERIECISSIAYLPPVTEGSAQSSSKSLPTIVKEKDIEYQISRMSIFRRLVAAHPYQSDVILSEAKSDITPIYRGFVWAALLGVNSSLVDRYYQADILSVGTSDKQIDLDIPRCHQYDALLSSPVGHRKLRRVVKAWVNTETRYVYWQGLDSLAAPFVYLHLNNEALAYACLCAFVERYPYKFFLADNSAVMHECLAVFNQLVAFHDPLLYAYMVDIDFTPELYAIQWFLTMFSHVFPLSKLMHLWDTLLLGDSSFPLCVGVAVLLQVRPRILRSGPEACLIFSDLPEIDIERCVEDSVKIYRSTPKSATFRVHAAPTSYPQQKTDQSPDMEGLNLADLRSYCCPRLSLSDLLRLTRSAGSGGGLNESSPANACAYYDSKLLKGQTNLDVIPVDIRPYDDYRRGTYPDSLHIAFDEEERTKNLSKLDPFKGNSIICIIHYRIETSQKFSLELVRSGYPRVTILDGGSDVLRTKNLLSVPTPHIQ